MIKVWWRSNWITVQAMNVNKKKAWSLKLNLERHDETKGGTLGFLISTNSDRFSEFNCCSWYFWAIEFESLSSIEEFKEENVENLRRLNEERGKRYRGLKKRVELGGEIEAEKVKWRGRVREVVGVGRLEGSSHGSFMMAIWGDRKCGLRAVQDCHGEQRNKWATSEQMIISNHKKLIFTNKKTHPL